LGFRVCSYSLFPIPYSLFPIKHLQQINSFCGQNLSTPIQRGSKDGFPLVKRLCHTGVLAALTGEQERDGVRAFGGRVGGAVTVLELGDRILKRLTNHSPTMIEPSPPDLKRVGNIRQIWLRLPF
jgi:hypothetical protein